MDTTGLDPNAAVASLGQPGIYLILRTISCLVCLVLFILVQRRLSYGRISYTLGLIWSGAFLTGIAVALFPRILAPLTHSLGFLTPANLIFTGAILFLIVITFVLSLKSAQHSRMIVRLVQRLALAEHELDRRRAGDESSARSIREN